MKTNLILAFCLSIGMAFAPALHAQETSSQTTTADKYVRLFLHNGGIYEGRVIEITTEYFLIQTLLMGETKISKSQIATLTYIEQNQMAEMKSNNRSADINPQSSRYFFSPSAHALKQGEGYYHNIALAYNSISYGITDDFTAGVTMTPIGMGATAKYSYQLSDKVSTSVGAIGVLPFASGDIGGAGIGFLNLTFGDERKNLSLNYGLAWYENTTTIYMDAYTDDNGEYHPAYPHYGDDGTTYYPMSYSEQGAYNAHMFNVSGMFEASSRIWILFETYFIFDPQTEDSGPINVAVMGVRSASKKRDALWDWGMVAIPSEEIYGIPWIACTVPF